MKREAGEENGFFLEEEQTQEMETSPHKERERRGTREPPHPLDASMGSSARDITCL